MSPELTLCTVSFEAEGVGSLCLFCFQYLLSSVFYACNYLPFEMEVWSRIWLEVRVDIKMIFDLASNIVFVKDAFIFISKFGGVTERSIISISGRQSRGMNLKVLRFGPVFAGGWAF